MSALAAGAVGVLVFARVGALHGDTIRLYAATGQARGILKGTEVWLAGQKVGLVSDVRFRPATVDTAQRLLIAMDILRPYQSQLRGDSYAQIRAGGSFIGAPVVYLSIGSPNAPPLEHQDTLVSKPQGDAEGMTSQVALATQEFPAIIANVRLLGAQLATTRGTAGAVLHDERSDDRLDAFRARASRFTRRAVAGDGTVGLALSRGDRDLAARARRAMAQVDSVRALVGSSATSLGRFRRDSTLLRSVADLRNEISIVRTRLADGRGTAGRAATDSSLARQLETLSSELSELMDDFSRHPLRYVAF